SDPKAPERAGSDADYELSFVHLEPTDASASRHQPLVDLIINQVRRLHLRGGYQASLILGQPTLETWEGLFGPASRNALRLAVELAVALRGAGRVPEANDLNRVTLARLVESFGADDETALTCAVNHGEDLRELGQFREALELDEPLRADYQRV